MKSIKENVTNKIEINKSIFITELVKVKNKDELNNNLEEIKNKYKDATHYCYAYIIDDLKKSSDDGEPGGTAGVPIIDTLNKANLNYILCVVIRYFGGIKLGAGGLVRAYRKSVSEALSKTELNELINGYEIIIETSYDKQKDLEYLIKDNYQKEYDLDVKYIINCDQDLKDLLLSKYKIESVTKIKLEKER
jgi:uncharacterized YigZ family protein